MTSPKRSNPVPRLTLNMAEIAEACRRYDVLKLDLFGSGTTETYDPARSDIDLLVVFHTKDWPGRSNRYFGLLEALQHITGRPIDLVEEAAVRNPHLREEIERSRAAVYHAP